MGDGQVHCSIRIASYGSNFQLKMLGRTQNYIDLTIFWVYQKQMPSIYQRNSCFLLRYNSTKFVNPPEARNKFKPCYLRKRIYIH